MKAKQLRKKLKNVPDDAEVLIKAYTYSASRKVLIPIENTIEDMEEYRFIIEVMEY